MDRIDETWPPGGKPGIYKGKPYRAFGPPDNLGFLEVIPVGEWDDKDKGAFVPPCPSSMPASELVRFADFVPD